MSISQRQFTLLTEMGITLWQRRATTKNPKKTTEANTIASNANANAGIHSSTNINIKSTLQTSNSQTTTKQLISNEATTKQSATKQATALSLTTLNNHPVFTDILLSLPFTADDIAIHNNQLSLKNIHWQFNEHDQITFSNNQLTTPSIEALAQSPQLKRQLWQTLQQITVTQ